MKFMIFFNHVDGAWDQLDEDTQAHHNEFLQQFMVDLKREQNTELKFFASPRQARHVRIQSDGSLSHENGPARPGAEQIGGYYIVDVETEDEAMAWAERGRFMLGANEVRAIVEFPA